MLKKYFFAIILLLLTGLVSGQKVTYHEAETVAKNHYYIYANILDNKAYDDITFSEHFALKNQQDTTFLIFNLKDNKGFVIVSADKRYHPIIGYSFEGNFDPENQAPSFTGYMELHKHELSDLRNKNVVASDEVKEEWTYLKQKPDVTKNETNSVEPLLTTNWSQGCGWNDFCPEHHGGPCGRTWVGCVAVAQAQIMKYWNFPEQGTGEYSFNTSTYGELSANFGETTYHWDNMPDNSPTDDIAQLMYHVGVSVQMGYGPVGSGASGGMPSGSLRNYFRYSIWDKDFPVVYPFTEIVNELEKSRPLYYTGREEPGDVSGHALVLDGYQYNQENENYYFHFNYGWGGISNGYYRLFTGNSYFNIPGVVLGSIMPTPDCEVFEVPFKEDFEGETHYCWTGNMYGGSWKIDNSRNYTPNGNNSAHYECLGNFGCNEDVYLISPRIQLPENPDSTIVLSFMSMNTCPSLYGNTKNRVLISIDDGESFTEIWEPGSVDNEWNKTTLNLDEYAGEIIKIAFKRDDYGSSDTHNWYFDDVKVQVLQPEKPVVATNVIGIVTENTAEIVGNVYEEGSAPLTARGVVWDTHDSPDIENNLGMTDDGTGIGVFFSSVTGLSEGTTYYVRTYATNDVGTSYGDTLSFTAQQDDFICGESTITDIDGNEYNTESFNSQCWMGENLRTTRYNDGTDIFQANCVVGFMFDDWSPNEDGAFIWAGNHIQNKEAYGAVYNQHAVDNERNICPSGWHIPSHYEWMVLEEHLGYHKPFYAAMTGWFGYKGGSKMAGNSELWHPAGDLINDEIFGTSGFNAVPAGWVISNHIAHDKKDAFYWTSSNGFYKRLTYDRKDIETNAGVSESTGMAVRCIRSLPSVRTYPVDEISTDTIKTGVQIINATLLDSFDGVLYGIVWADFENPTLANHTGKQEQILEDPARFHHLVGGIEQNVTYHIRSFITYNDGTTYYGNEVKYRIFPTPQPCLGSETITDIDGNIYNTLLLGDQCWMVENLKTSRHANGDPIARICPPTDPDCIDISGALYTWNTAMHGEMPGNENPSGVQGICPDGWHLPGDAEWTQMENYLIDNAYNFGYDLQGNKLAKALATNLGSWNQSNSADPKPGTPKWYPEENNSSGFSAYGTYSQNAEGTLIWPYINSHFWTSTAKNIHDAVYRQINYNNQALLTRSTSKQSAFSVRCIKSLSQNVAYGSLNESGYRVYPNPTDGIFTIKSSHNFSMTNTLIEVYNTQSERVFKSKPDAQSEYSVDLSGQPNGVYFLKVTESESAPSLLFKIVKM